MTRFVIRSVVLGLWLAGTAAAGELPAPTPVVESDRDLERKADAALAKVPELHRLNLIVSVVGRAAVVGGAVPDEAARARVEAVLRTVPGLTDVKVACWVPVAEDPLVAKVGQRLTAPVVGGPTVPTPSPTPPPATSPPVPNPRPHSSTGVVTAQRVVPPTVDFRLLLDPVTSVGPQRPAQPPPYPTIPAPAVPTVPAEGPADVLAGLKAKSPRFAGLTVSMANGVATVSGSATDPAAAWEVAAAMRAAAGVDRVVIGELR